MRIVARNSDPQTSWDAAASVDQVREKQTAVLRVLTQHGPLTHEELVSTYYDAQLGLPMQSPSGIRTRCNELVKMGLVEWTGEKRVMTTGRKARVWRAIDVPRED